MTEERSEVDEAMGDLLSRLMVGGCRWGSMKKNIVGFVNGSRVKKGFG